MQKEIKRLNPWLSVWIKPRRTIRQIIETNPRHLIYILAITGGFLYTLIDQMINNSGNYLGVRTIIILSSILGPLGGLIALFLFGELYSWAGQIIGGEGTVLEARASVAWSNVPIIMTFFLWVPKILLYQNEAFTSYKTCRNTLLDFIWVSLTIIIFIIVIWEIIIEVACLKEIHNFGTFKAILCYMIANIICALMSLAIGVVFVIALIY